MQPTYIEMTARISPEGHYRYHLSRIWNRDWPRCVFIMLNPSTADATKDDPTIAKCARFARDWGFGQLDILNLFAWRSTDPKNLKLTHTLGKDPIGPGNTETILEMVRDEKVGRVIAAWGQHGNFLDRGMNVAQAIIATGRDLYALRLSQDKTTPWHPLYLPGDTIPFPWLKGIQ